MNRLVVSAGRDLLLHCWAVELCIAEVVNAAMKVDASMASLVAETLVKLVQDIISVPDEVVNGLVGGIENDDNASRVRLAAEHLAEILEKVSPQTITNPKDVMKAMDETRQTCFREVLGPSCATLFPDLILEIHTVFLHFGSVINSAAKDGRVSQTDALNIKAHLQNFLRKCAPSILGMALDIMKLDFCIQTMHTNGIRLKESGRAKLAEVMTHIMGMQRMCSSLPDPHQEKLRNALALTFRSTPSSS